MTPTERVLLLLTLDGPQTLDELAHRLGLPRRTVERAIQALRLGGHAIGSDDRGVWLAHTRAEGLEAYRRLRSRALEQLHTASAVKRAAYRLPEMDELNLGLVG